MRVDYRSLKPYRDHQASLVMARRLLVLRLALVFGFLLYVGIFGYLQVVKGPEYRRMAEENRLRRRVERPVRGVIRDDVGGLLVSNRPSFSVYLDRQRTRDERGEIEKLARFLGEDPAPMLEQLDRRRRQPRFLPIPLLPDIGFETAARLAAHRPELPAIDVVSEAKRHYPLGAAAAHVIGYVAEATQQEVRDREDLLPGDRVGRTGVEASYDEDLRGEHGRLLEEVNARGRALRTVATERAARHGPALGVTLDGAMQRDLHEAFAGRAGAAVFLDPQTGALRGLYSGPSYDPNVFAGRLSAATWRSLSEDPRRPLQNRALAGIYSPGSTFKIIMAAAALQEGQLAPGEKIFCGGVKKYYGDKRHCHRRWGHGKIGLSEALERSCNIFFYEIGQRLGIERIEHWARAFGLGQTYGLGLGTESSGLVPSNAWKLRTRGEPWYPGETISVSIGQGPLHVTPLQMAVAAAVVANGGKRVQPFVRPRDAGTHAPIDIGLDPETLAAVGRGLVLVVHGEGGTAGAARVLGVKLAGKTGTAQVVALDAENDPGDHALFVGYGPVEAPELAWAVVVEHAGHGGESAAPIVSTVVGRYLERRRAAPGTPSEGIEKDAENVTKIAEGGRR